MAVRSDSLACSGHAQAKLPIPANNKAKASVESGR